MQRSVDAHTYSRGKKVHNIEHQLPPGSPPRTHRQAGKRNDVVSRPADSLGRSSDVFGCSAAEHKPKDKAPRHNHAQNEVTNHGTSLTGGDSTRHGLHQCSRHNHLHLKQSDGWEPKKPGWSSKVNQSTFSFQDPPHDVPAPKCDVKPDLVPDTRGSRHITHAYKGYTTA